MAALRDWARAGMTTARKYTPPRPFVDWTSPFAERETAETAYHEAAHVVVGRTLGFNIARVTIEGDETSLGRTQTRGAQQDYFDALDHDDYLPEWCFREVAFSVAGLVAEHFWFDRGPLEDWYDVPVDMLVDEHDWGRAILAAGLLAEEQASDYVDARAIAYVEAVTTSVQKFLARRPVRLRLGEIARLLHVHGTIDEHAIGDALDGHPFPARWLSLEDR
jgi:hypothetical protein